MANLVIDNVHKFALASSAPKPRPEEFLVKSLMVRGFEYLGHMSFVRVTVTMPLGPMHYNSLRRRIRSFLFDVNTLNSDENAAGFQASRKTNQHRRRVVEVVQRLGYDHNIKRRGAREGGVGHEIASDGVCPRRVVSQTCGILVEALHDCRCDIDAEYLVDEGIQCLRLGTCVSQRWIFGSSRRKHTQDAPP